MKTPKVKRSTEMQAELAKIGVNLKLENPGDEIEVVLAYTKLIQGYNTDQEIALRITAGAIRQVKNLYAKK